ncbi:trypsin-like serine peptidase [Pseudomonas sp. R1-6]|uniref:trypsin-like serine peptidase n=1 Tax=Pseudomonas sp. R1-6 TaxID=2817397 RepID=UPI003DA805A3
MRSILFPLMAVLCVSALQGIAHSKDYGDGLQNFAASRVLENADGKYDYWRGIGRLYTDSYCTATLLDTQDSTVAGPTPAYVVTTGLCTRQIDESNMTDTPISGHIYFSYFADTLLFQIYPVKKVAWRSMHGTNLSIIELNVSLQELIRAGIKPLKLAQGQPTDGTDVLTVGASLGFPKNTLRMAACTLQSADEVIKGQFVWRNNIMNQCSDLAGGSEGGPILDRYTNEIVGVLNTSATPEGFTPCEWHVPCMRTNSGYKPVPDNHYGTSTAFLNGCFVQGHLVKDVTASCALYPSFSVDLEKNSPARYQRLVKQPDGTIAIPTWNYRFKISTAFYRHKTVRTAKHCENGQNYSDPISSVDAFIDTDIGTQPGVYFLCIIGVDSSGPAEPLTTLSLPVEILDGAPTAQPNLSIYAGIGVALEQSEDQYHTYAIKFGPPETTDCTEAQEYEPYDQRGYLFENEELPQKFCSIAYDKMNQESKPREDLLSPATSRQETSPTL